MADSVKDLAEDVQKQHAQLLEYRSSIEHAEKALGAACKDYYKSAKRLTRLRSKAKDENSEALDTISEQLDEIKSIRPQTGSLFVRLWLGHVNVKEHTKGDKLKLRNEYDKFKDKTNMVFLMLAVLGLATNHYLAYKWSYTHWIFNVTHIWLLYYYVSLALRENILKVNGSNIRDWWIIHHYLSALLSIVFITWPPTDTYRMFSDQFMYYFLYQAVVQFLQAGYQKRRHYPRRAMGKATAMDVSSSETLTEIPSEFYVLVVIVLLAQAFQVYNGGTLLYLLATEMHVDAPWWEWTEEFQAWISGCIFILLGVCNCYFTFATVIAKVSKSKSKAIDKVQASDKDK